MNEMGDAAEALYGVFNALHACFKVETGEQRQHHAAGNERSRELCADEDDKTYLKVYFLFGGIV